MLKMDGKPHVADLGESVDTLSVDPSVAFAARLPKSIGLKEPTERDPSSLSPFERKEEFYRILKNIAIPSFAGEIAAIRQMFPHGLVRFDGSCNLQSSIDAPFLVFRHVRGTSAGKSCVRRSCFFKALIEPFPFLAPSGRELCCIG